MEIKPKELGQDILVHFDYSNYKKFKEEVKKLAKKFEHKSNYKKLNYSILFNCRKRPKEPVKGWASRVITKKEGIKEIIFLDYDNILLKLALEELLFLTSKHKLSPFYLFTSFETTAKNGEIYGNYMAVSIAKKSYAEVIRILRETHADNSYKVVPTSYPYKTWVLRLGKKFKKKSPKFKCVVGNLKKTYDMSCSEAHLDILKQLVPNLPKIKYKNLDGNHKLFLSEYLTASK